MHEAKGVNEFKPYFKGDVYLDKEVRMVPTFQSVNKFIA